MSLDTGPNFPEALRLAAQADDPQRRHDLCREALLQWAAQDPEAALAWARAQDETSREDCLLAALTGAAQNPQTALPLLRAWLAEAPAQTNRRGGALLASLLQTQQFFVAWQLAQEAPTEFSADWVSLALQGWVARDPQAAARAYASLSNSDLQAAVFPTLISSWASSHPETLPDYALTLPPGEARAQTINTALQAWALQDPNAIAQWLNDHQLSAEFDQGIAYLVTHTDSVNRPAEVALDWAENIHNEPLRQQSIIKVVRAWAGQDRIAALNYVTRTSALDAAQKADLVRTLAATSHASLTTTE